MANKQLTATVRLNTKQAEQQLKKLSRAIDAMNNAVGKKTSAYNAVNRELSKSVKTTNQVKTATDQWAQSQKQVNNNLKNNNSILNSVGNKLKSLAATYMGIMGTKAVINTSDTITKAQNKLNNINGGDKELTQHQMDTMYASANKVRMSYTDMLNNASKSMTLAPDAFQGDMDNAIRFQEIMAETYALGGASAEEMSTSMYQMIQALGSGTLAGDELRSVREGAPLAYQAIEEYVQGVMAQSEATKEYATKSLKDIASHGLVTSDMVVAAVMDAGSTIDAQFDKTAMTFENAWDRIKNAAVKAFEPVSKMLNKMLNDAANNGAFEKIEQAFWNISKVIQIVFQVIYNIIDWIAERWNWLKYVVMYACVVMALYLAYVGYQAVATAIKAVIAWVAVNASMLLTIAIIAAVVVALVWLASQCESVCDFIYQLCIILANAIIACILIVLVVYLVAGTLMLSIPQMIALIVLAVLALLIGAFVKFTGAICGFCFGLYESIAAICNNIKHGWLMMCDNMREVFWNSIADMLESCEWLLDGINAIASALGMKTTISVEGVRAKAEAARASMKSHQNSIVSVGDAWDKGYAKGYKIGESIQDSINQAFSFDSFGNNLGLDFSSMTSGFPSAYDPQYDTTKTYTDPGAEKLLSGIKDDTDSIDKHLGLTEEDLDYLRRIADMEWKKEYTTASITVEMTNNNSISSDYDLESLAIALGGLVEEEMYAVANGVHTG